MIDDLKKWVLLNLCHPLKHHRILWFIMTIDIFLIIVDAQILYHYNYHQISLENISIFIQDNPLLEKCNFELALGIAIPFFLSVILFYLTQNDIKRLEFAEYIKMLLKEIQDNKEQLNQLDSEIKKRVNEFEKSGNWTWMPKKKSYTNWANGNNFQYKYFATTAYFYFINQRFMLNASLSIPHDYIGNLYDFFKDFNVKLQQIENLFVKFPNIQKLLLNTNVNNQNKSNPVIINFNNISYQFKNENEVRIFLIDSLNEFVNKEMITLFNKYFKIIYENFYEYYDFDDDIWSIENKN